MFGEGLKFIEKVRCMKENVPLIGAWAGLS